MLMLSLILLAFSTAQSAVFKEPSSLHDGQRLQRNMEEVKKMLEQSNWYSQLSRLLRNSLLSSGNPHLRKFPIFQRSGSGAFNRQNKQLNDERKPAVLVELNYEGRTLINITKFINESSAASDLDDVITADINNTEIRLSLHISNVGTDAVPKEGDLQHPQMTDKPMAAQTTGPKAQGKTTNPSGNPTDINGYQIATEEAGNGEHQLFNPCTTENFCLHGGICKKYSIIDMEVCNCKLGFKGDNCERYDLLAILTATEVEKEEFGKGLISDQQFEKMQSLVKAVATIKMETNLKN